MKALTRKTRAIERGNLIRTGGGPQQPPPSSELGAIINMVEDVGNITPLNVLLFKHVNTLY